MSGIRYTPRLVDPVIDELLRELPALFLTGPRAAGKTTTAVRRAASVVRLDRPAEAAVVSGDPDAVLNGRPEPVLIDEWQLVPTVLGAVKRSVDRDPTPGRFIITGSARSEEDLELWPGTGRLVRVPLSGLVVRERRGDIRSTPLLERIVDDGPENLPQPVDPPDLRGYVDELLVPGFPFAALQLPRERRSRWLMSYLDQLVTRDALQVEPGRDPSRLGRYLETLAIHTAAVVDARTLYRGAGINRKTALAYERLLSGLSVVEALPAWWSNRFKRLVQRPKRVITDPALAAAALRIDADGILRDGSVLGALLETFVIAQLRAELPASKYPIRLHHLRTEQGRHEVDIIAELSRQTLVALEVKATAAPRLDDARHLVWLRDELGERFTAGIVLHTGPRVFMLAERIAAVPIAAFWDPASRSDGSASR